MIEDSDPCLGIYDMRVDTTGMPEFLANKINNNICNKGGGGGRTQTTSSGIDPEFKPYLKRVLSDVTDKYESDVAAGPDAIVAKMTQQQKDALQAQEAAARDMQAGRGLYDTRAAERRALQDLQGTSMSGAYGAGGLGSARSQMAMQGALAARAGDYQQQRQKTSQMGTKMLGEAGAAQQTYNQARMDAPHTAASRYFGYLQNAPQQSTTTESGGGGK
jgi:hypothetical protein